MMSEKWKLVEKSLSSASGIAWDGCHKIYVLMDDNQMKEMQRIGYEPLIYSKDRTSTRMFDILQDWWAESCELRFINAVSTNEEDPNAGFESLIAQFEDDDEEVST